MAQRIVLTESMNDAEGIAQPDAILVTLSRDDAFADTLSLTSGNDLFSTVTLDNDTARDLANAILAWVGKRAPVVAVETDEHASEAVLEAAITAGENAAK